jgi:hypothetical protein
MPRRNRTQRTTTTPIVRWCATCNAISWHHDAQRETDWRCVGCRDSASATTTASR